MLWFGIELFVVGPPEQLGVVPLVTFAGCCAVSVQSIVAEAVLLKPEGMFILNTTVRVVAVLTVAYLPLRKPESLLVKDLIDP